MACVSGIATTSRTSPASATAASPRKPAASPKRSTTYPVTVVLSAAPAAVAVPIAPCATLKRPVPRVTSATTSGATIMKIVAASPSRIWMATSSSGRVVIENSKPRSGCKAKPARRSGRRPHRSACRPHHGAQIITTTWVIMMQDDRSNDDRRALVDASTIPSSGSIDAFAK